MEWKKMVSVKYWDEKRQSFEPAETFLQAFGFAKWEDLPRVISLVGAGGKTSTMYDLAGELSGQGARVLMTTSTHIAKPVQFKTAVAATLGEIDFESFLENTHVSILAAGKQAEEPKSEWKLTMPEDLGEDAVMKRLLTRFDIILIEADGSKRLPMKIPSEREPVLIPQTGLVIACMGLTAGGKTFGDACFRFDSHGAWLKRNEADPIEAADMARILADERGSKKKTETSAYRILLNQADTKREERFAEEIVRALPRDLQSQCVVTARTVRTDTERKENSGWAT